jgi:magnesium-transporting ATPase (P-type)
MKKFINSTLAKYTVNVLMIFLFAGSAITGLFFMEGGERSERGAPNGQEQVSGRTERTNRHELGREAKLERHEEGGNEERRREEGGSEERDGEREGEEGDGEIHELAGIMWLVLMTLHTIQHWYWYKKLFSPAHIMKNKLLTVTVFVFILMALSSIGMLIELEPLGLFDLKEIHEVLGQVTVGLVLLHIIQRLKWYVAVTKNLFTNKIKKG